MSTPFKPDLPTSPDAELAVLGSVVLDASGVAFSQAAAGLRPDDFALDSHRRIFMRMGELAEAGKPIDYVTLSERLQSHGELELCGGIGYVTSLSDGIPRVRNIEQYVRIVRDKAMLRKLYHASAGTAVEACEYGAEAGDCIAGLQDRLLEILSGPDESVVCNSTETSKAFRALLDRLSGNSSELAGLSTGVADLDFSTTGIREGELWIVGARPGNGKTTLARQILRRNASEDVPCLFFSLEMAKEWIRAADVAAESGVPFSLIRSGKLNSDDRARVLDAAKAMSRWPYNIVDKGGMDIRELIALANLNIRQRGIKLIVVDYLQIIWNREMDRASRAQQIGVIADKLRILAKTTGVPVVLLSQLSRPKDGDMRPKLWQLKESGDIEAHAHVVVMPYLPETDEGEKTGEDELIIAKQRFGQVGPVKVTMLKQSLKFAPRTHV